VRAETQAGYDDHMRERGPGATSGDAASIPALPERHVGLSASGRRTVLSGAVALPVGRFLRFFVSVLEISADQARARARARDCAETGVAADGTEDGTRRRAAGAARQRALLCRVQVGAAAE